MQKHSFSKRFKNHRSSESQEIFANSKVDILFSAKLVCEGNAAEVLAALTLVHGHNVEDDQERDEQSEGCKQTSDDGENPAFPTVKESGLFECQIRQEADGEEEAADEAEDVGVVVDPG